MRLIFSRKGFDSTSGGCASPIFPDGSMISLPIPDRTSPVRYRDLEWNGHNLGEVVEKLTKGKQRASFGAHLDPDLRPQLRPRSPGWRPVLGQHTIAQAHLRNQGVGLGDLFLFWGVFRKVDAELRWLGPSKHVIWGWLQVEIVAAVDAEVRPAINADWSWAKGHPHLHFPEEAANTLYVAAPELRLPGLAPEARAGTGVFDFYSGERQLTAARSPTPSTWALPACFAPNGRPALSYHQESSRWTKDGTHTLLTVASRGQEFVLDLDHHPETVAWIGNLLSNGPCATTLGIPPLSL